jgi:hypothetical protein
MTWTILFLNIATLVIALKKRVLPYFLFTLYFLFLVVGQAFQIQSDLRDRSSVSYLYAFMTREGFAQALWFLLGISVLSLVLVLLAEGYKPGTQPSTLRSFEPPRFFYIFMFLFLSGLSGVLIFVVAGLSAFLSSSRPGFESGSTIFLTLLGFGIYPLLLKIIYRSPVKLGDLACAGITLFVSLGFSRMHVILYVTTILTTMYYGWGWADRRIRPQAVIGFGALALFGAFSFIAVGALRNAQSYTGGSIEDLWRYNLDHPEKNMLSLDVMYQRSVEGMSGLTGAFTQASVAPQSIRNDYGVAWITQGVMLALPGPIKAQFSGIEDALLPFHWYDQSIISPGVETSFTSFGWLGFIFYSLAFFAIAWSLCLFVVDHQFSPPLKLCGFMLLGCGIFFVRGTFSGWIGYSIAYTVTILGSAPLWRLWVVPGRALKTSDPGEYAQDRFLPPRLSGYRGF